MGQIRHEIDLTCSRELRDYLRSPQFQDQVRQFVADEYTIDLECIVPPEGKNPELDTNLSIRLTYHPNQPHDFNKAKKHITTLLAERGVPTKDLNRRSFDIAFPADESLISQLQDADFAPLLNQYQISATLGAPIPSHQLQTIVLSYHRNFSDSVAAAITSISNSLSVPLTSLVHAPLPTSDPDTFSAYSKAHAYDVARKEFYEARHRQDIERRVAKEEALFTGAEFGPSALEVGMQLEDEKFEEWKAWAVKEIAQQKQLAGSAYTGITEESSVLETEDPATQEGLDELEPVVPGTKRGQEALGGALVHP